MLNLHWLRSRAIHSACLLLCMAVAYGQSLNYDFVWDDVGLIVKNEAVQTIGGWRRLFTGSFWQIGENVEDDTRSFYRPLVSLSYGIDYAFWGLTPFGYHLTNLVLHGLACLAVYALASVMLRSSTAAFAGSLLWAVHPTHVENVCWISGRTDILCGGWYFVTLYFFHGWMARPRRRAYFLAAMVGCYALALLSKEMAVSLPLVIVGWRFARAEDARTAARMVDWVVLIAALSAVTAGYFVIRAEVLGSAVGVPVYGTVRERLLSLPMVFARYIGLVLTVVPVDPHHAEGFVTTACSLTFLRDAALCLSYVLWMLHLWRSDRTLAAVLFAWFAVTLLPVFYLGSFGDVLYADRFLYIPAVGFFLGAAQTVRGAWPKSEGMRARWRALIGVLHAVVSICLITYASQSARYWKDGPTLFRRASATSPDSAYIHFNLGSCLIRRGAHEDAMKAYRRAADLAPRFPQVYVNLGAALARVGRHDEALAYFRQAMLLGDNGYLVHAHLGNCYGELGFAEQAEEAYARSLSLRETAWVHARLGALLLDATRPEAAEAHLRRSLALEPSAETYLYLGVLFARNGEPEQALACLKCCLRFPVGRRSMRVTAATHLELARLYMRLLREYEASVHMAEAWRCTSSDPATYDMVSRFAEQLNDAETDIRSHGLGLP